jgi:zinc transporter
LRLWLSLADGLERAVGALQEPLAELEYDILYRDHPHVEELRELRRRTALLRWQTAQREVLGEVLSFELTWLTGGRESEWRSIIASLAQDSRDLDSVFERTRVLHDYLEERASADLNRRLYVIALLSTIMLPLTFVTSLLGINVGIRGNSFRGAEAPWAFFAVVMVLVMAAIFEFAVLRRRKWL